MIVASVPGGLRIAAYHVPGCWSCVSLAGDPDGPAQVAQIHLAHAWVMLNTTREGRTSPAHAGYQTQSLTVFVDDVDRHFKTAKAADAKIVEKLNETVYGELQYRVEHPRRPSLAFLAAR